MYAYIFNMYRSIFCKPLPSNNLFFLFSEPHIRIAPVITEVGWKLEGLD